MTTFTQRLVHIHSCRGASWLNIKYIFEEDPTLKRVFHYSIKELSELLRIKPPQLKIFFHDLHRYSTKDLTNLYDQRNIFTTTIFNKEYPHQLRQIYDPPWVLYGKGNISLLSSKKLLAIVGTRHPTELGQRSLMKLIPPLMSKEWTIVSGMAKGIDRLAHEFASKYGGKTIAVLGSGLSHPYPKSNLVLFDYLTKNHLVLSEYPPYTPPNKWQFPARNRIISGLSKGVLVIEAKEKSGSLITADQALEQGRDVFAVPGPIYSPQSDGTNFLIQQGAILVTSAKDILQEY